MNPFTLFIIRSIAWVIACIASMVALAVLLIRDTQPHDWWAVAVACAVVCECIRPDRERFDILMRILRDDS